jgi:glycosyltransferase involved in cell wall biosynthesis
MHLIVFPSPIEAVGAHPEIVVQGAPLSAGLEALVFAQPDFERHGPWHAAPAARVELVSDGSRFLAGTTDRALADGRWMVCIVDRARRRLSASAQIRVEAGADAWPQVFERVLNARLQRLAATPPPASSPAGEPPLASLITPVHDAEPEHLQALARSVLAQSFARFEWLVLDNGSRRPDTRAALDGLAHADARITLHRGTDNLHIVGGHRFLLERARGRFVLPVDHDDVLYPDALERLALEAHARPEVGVFFSFEQRISPLGRPMNLIWRLEWSRLFALASGPAAHLVAYRRDLALAAGVYTGSYASGSVDWDTVLRLADAGATLARIPEVLYGWRAHRGSTALSGEAKGYVEHSQKALLHASLQRRGLEHLFTLENTRDEWGYYHWVRRKEHAPRLALDLVVRAAPGHEENLQHNLGMLSYPALDTRVVRADEPARLGALASEVPAGCFAKAVIDCGNRIADPDWAWDAVGTLELDAEVGLVSGPILNRHACIASAGYVAGIDGFYGIPRLGQVLDAMPSPLLGRVRRHVMGLHSGFLVVRAGVAARCGPLLSVDAEDALNGIEYCLRCRVHGILSAYTPRMRSERDELFTYPVGSSDAALREHIAERYGPQILADPYYSTYLSKDSIRYGDVDPCAA